MYGKISLMNKFNYEIQSFVMYGKNIRYRLRYLGVTPRGSGGSMSENDGYDEVPLGGFGGFDNE